LQLVCKQVAEWVAKDSRYEFIMDNYWDHFNIAKKEQIVSNVLTKFDKLQCPFVYDLGIFCEL